MSDTNRPVPHQQQAYEAFNQNEAKVMYTALIVLGCVTLIGFCLVSTFIMGAWTMYVLGVYGFFGVFYFPIPIVAGFLGLLSSKHKSNGMVVAFMVLSIISAIFAALMTLICITLTVYLWGIGVGGWFLIGVAFFVAFTYISIYCSVLGVKFAVVVPQQTCTTFDKKKAKVSSIAILLLGCVSLCVMIVYLVRFGMLTRFGLPINEVFSSLIPIVLGALGIISAKKPLKENIVAFKVLSIICVIIAASMILFYSKCIQVQASYEYTPESTDYTRENIAIIFYVIFYVILAILSFYCFALCSKHVGCCGCCSSKSEEREGVVLGQIYRE